MLSKILIGVLAVALFAAVAAVVVPLEVLGGVLGGWSVEWLWPVTTAEVLAACGIKLALWKIGGAFGFVGGFFKSTFIKN